MIPICFLRNTLKTTILTKCYLFPIGKSGMTYFLSKATDGDAAEQPRSQSKYNNAFYYILLTIQEHDCSINWEQYGLIVRCEILLSDEQPQMKALLFYLPKSQSRNATLSCSLPGSVRIRHRGSGGTSYKVALEDPAKIVLHKLTSRSCGATQVLHFSCTAAEKKNDNFYQKPALREINICASPSVQVCWTTPQLEELKRAGERWHSSSLVSGQRNVHWQCQAVVPNTTNLSKLHIL